MLATVLFFARSLSSVKRVFITVNIPILLTFKPWFAVIIILFDFINKINTIILFV